MRLMTKAERGIGINEINREIANHSRIIKAQSWGGVTMQRAADARRKYDELIELKTEFLNRPFENY